MTVSELNDHDRLLLTLLAEGKSIKQIHAEVHVRLGSELSISSVKFALSRLYRRLGAANSNAAAACYVQNKRPVANYANDPV